MLKFAVHILMGSHKGDHQKHKYGEVAYCKDRFTGTLKKLGPVFYVFLVPRSLHGVTTADERYRDG